MRSAERPYVVLISFDGFRSDYIRLYDAPNLRKLASLGASSRALLPCYPSTTFANHYSIATGLYPEHHGIVDNNFYDPRRRDEFQFNDAKYARDGTWYGGAPIWVTAEKQGVRTASYFWVGSEAEIEGARPSFYYNYDSSVPGEARVKQVLDWLKLPGEERPHLITLYFSDADTAGHNFGPQSSETAKAVARLDALTGALLHGMEASGLPVDIVLVSDHGMAAVVQAPLEIDGMADLSAFTIAWSGGQMMLYSADARAIDRLYRDLKDKDDRIQVHRRAELAALRYSANDRIGDIVVITRPPYMVSTREITSILSRRGANALPLGWHGYDVAQVPEMAGIFIAWGPHIRGPAQLDPFENIHVYPFIADLLGLDPAPAVDGNPEMLRSLSMRESVEFRREGTRVTSVRL